MKKISRFNIRSWALGLICGGVIAFVLTAVLMPSKVITEQVFVPSVQIIREEVERPVTTTIYVPVYQDKEVVKEVTRQVKFFQSVEELKDWLNKQPRYMPSFPNFDCDDLAKWTQLDAIESGYQMSTELDWRDGLPHMLNSVIIGNELYFIEPQYRTFWLRTELD